MCSPLLVLSLKWHCLSLPETHLVHLFQLKFSKTLWSIQLYGKLPAAVSERTKLTTEKL